MEKNEVYQLAKTGIFQNNPLDGNIVETNISWVILTKKFAFKLKKPIKLSFLDYSSLEKRKKNCERELMLNRRYSSIYLEVVPIRIFENSWYLGVGPGEIIDYAVCMRKLRNSMKMDEMLRNNEVNHADIQRLASLLAKFHKEAKVVRATFELDKAKNIFNDLETIHKIAQDELGLEIGRKIMESIAWSDTFLEKHAQRFQERISEGWTRDLHGDLHSGNIFLYQDPIIFDCIEFKDSFRQIDILYEIAFLCMDLEHFGRQDLSVYFLHCYQESMNCFRKEEDRELFHYFKALRANVRAKVYFLNALSDTDQVSRISHVKIAKSYMNLLFEYQKISRINP
jgi:uncharacterized protein